MTDNQPTILATIYYTADIFTRDDTDTNVYGDPCEPGYGESMESGWWDEDFDAFTVFDDKADVRPDVVMSDDDRFDDGHTLDDIIKSDIGDRLGSIDSFDGFTAYAADPMTNYATGERVARAAHVTYHNDDESTVTQ